MWIVGEQFIRRKTILQDICSYRPHRNTSAGDRGLPPQMDWSDSI
jgi:hypothetical protein